MGAREGPQPLPAASDLLLGQGDPLGGRGTGLGSCGLCRVLAWLLPLDPCALWAGSGTRVSPRAVPELGCAVWLPP